MNPSEVDERCLPSASKWTKRSDRQDFIDICASPPADGFFYANQHSRMNRQQQTAIGGCVQLQEDSSKDSSMGSINTKFSGGGERETPAGDGQVGCFNSESSGFFKSYGPAYPATNGGGDASNAGGVGSLLTGKVLNMTSTDLEKWAKKNVTGKPLPMAVLEHPTDDSAPTPVDHLVSQVPQVQITKTEDGGSTRLIERYGTPDVTPSTTPAVTPVCSPQVPRRSGNPFFSGNTFNGKEEGQWLFRSATPEATNNVLYEAQRSPNFPRAGGKNSVKYVPRPSHLRELNCWSPTSM